MHILLPLVPATGGKLPLAEFASMLSLDVEVACQADGEIAAGERETVIALGPAEP